MMQETATSVIRDFEPSDLDGVIQVFRSNIPKYFGPDEEAGLRSYLAEFARDYFLIEIGDEIVGSGGFALNSSVEQTVSLCWGMIRSDYLGTGLGRLLTDFRIERIRERFPKAPIVISTSQHTQGFYEKFGFVLTRHTPDGFGPGIDICEMRMNPSHDFHE